MKNIPNSELNRTSTDEFFLLEKHAIKQYGYLLDNMNFVIENQLTRNDLWDLFIDQFIKHPDKINNWRGEFFGKMMRAGALMYKVNKNEKLYKSLTYAAKKMLTSQDELGRFSTYSIEYEFKYWDMWCRKYVILGLIYYCDICRSESLKRKIVNALKKHANYIIKHVGTGKNKIGIFETSQWWGALNSCSILEAFMKLYNVTNEEKYLKFATYLVNSGLCVDFNLVEESLNKTRFPYQFEHTKAYEMMSCIEGLAEYYRVTKNEKYKTAVINFVDMVIESDVTVIGCCGTTHELFDHSKVTQTEETEQLLQETCVTVTWMKLLLQTLLLTGDAKYANEIERSALNAMPGSLNTEHQHSIHASQNLYKEEYTFDSYSPLVNTCRGRQIGGYQDIEGRTSYGCCACIGSAGIAMPSLFGALYTKDGVVINLYNKMKVSTEKIKIDMSANLYKSGKITIKIQSEKPTNIYLRMPEWSKTFKVSLNGINAGYHIKNGYAVINIKSDSTIKLLLDASIKKKELNDKIYFVKGPFVLARDSQFKENIKEEVGDIKHFTALRINAPFKNNIAYQIKTENKVFSLVDYASAGKNWDSENSLVSIFLKK